MRNFFHIFKNCDSKILQFKSPTQVADREGLSTNRYFSVVPSMIDACFWETGMFLIFHLVPEVAQDHRT